MKAMSGESWLSCLGLLVLLFTAGCPSRSFACETRHPRTRRSPHHRLGHYPRHRGSGSLALTQRAATHAHIQGPALYFSGKREQLRRRTKRTGRDIPNESFSVALWVKAEGGQNNPAVIVGLFDDCFYGIHNKGWTVGIEHAKPDGRPRVSSHSHFFVSLRTDRAPEKIYITSPSRYTPGVWTHIAATYNGHWLALFVNGVQVALGKKQASGPLFAPGAAPCKSLFLGGDHSTRGYLYRGFIYGLQVWSTSLTQTEIRYLLMSDKVPSPSLYGNFHALNSSWMRVRRGGYPRLVPLPDGPPHLPNLPTILPPPCGQTVCDNVRIVSSYNNYWPLHELKVMRYRLVNIRESDGSRPTIQPPQIKNQHLVLNQAFERYNISWELSVLDIPNSLLRRRIILANCDFTNVGNDICNPECSHPLTGFDGGDCLPSTMGQNTAECSSHHIRNGRCDPECNTVFHNFDDGECCAPGSTNVTTNTCFDPDSPNRAYMDVKELKELLKLDGNTHLNIYFANSVADDLAGVATWPWDKEALTSMGGVVLNPTYYGEPGHTHTIIHEIGHNLGLYHVFRGVSETESCSDPCIETEPSLERGDLCADTSPTPQNKLCRDPDPANNTCHAQHFRHTPFNNYMSYADDSCTNSFTANQAARMHCYIDLIYQGWRRNYPPMPIPLPPIPVAHSSSYLTLEWLPPINGHVHERDMESECELCGDDGTLEQYASKASSSRICYSVRPKEAEGPPDVEQPCMSSPRAWSPRTCNPYRPTADHCLQNASCTLELTFPQAILPEMLSIWVTFISLRNTEPIQDLYLLLANGKIKSLGPRAVFCDVPLTIWLGWIRSEVSGVRISTCDEKMEVDAAMLHSMPAAPACRRCRPQSYKLTRKPPFPEGRSEIVVQGPQRRYNDTSVKAGEQYTYQVAVLAENGESRLSPPFVYTHGGPFCGDGILQEDDGEECDDENGVDGDGCTSSCHIQEMFHCTGQPSVCFQGGEDFACDSEEDVDCPIRPPTGFIDHWASEALASHDDQKHCPARSVLGMPSVHKPCRSRSLDQPKSLKQWAWFPCPEALSKSFQQPPISVWNPHTNGNKPFWLKANFPSPVEAWYVVVHLASDGASISEGVWRSIQVFVIDTHDKAHLLGEFEVSCQHNPLVAAVRAYNESNHADSFHTKAAVLLFDSPDISIVAAALRTHVNTTLRPPGPPYPSPKDSCDVGKTYDPRSKRCVCEACQKQACPTMAVPSGVVTYPGAGEKVDRAHCEVRCKAGHVVSLDGHARNAQRYVHLSCHNGNWEHAVACIPIDCGTPASFLVYYAEFTCTNGTTFGQQCTFHCLSPAQQQGANTDIVCKADGLWSLPEAFCHLSCPAPPAMPHAIIRTQRCQNDGQRVGAACKYRCLPGYYIPSTRRKVFKIKCMEDGMWEAGGCEPVQCPPLPAVLHGSYTCTRDFNFGSRCHVNCPAHKHRTIVCKKSGRWSGRLKMCPSIKGSCSAPTPQLILDFDCPNGYAIGSACVAHCEIPFNDAVMWPKNITAHALPEKVEAIVCTARQEWYPPLNWLHCVQTCARKRDGWCDPLHNNAYCEYDGGDCCASTSISKQVIPFPTTCSTDKECACLDPAAKENSKKRRAWPGGWGK
uniref:Pappalysin 2 n=2 Tax=Eptatretus burgeri TaxID=7764 RepID=A0A8C4R7J7_EPTBU